MRHKPVILVVSHDSALRADLARLLGTVGLGVEHGSSPQAPGCSHEPRHGCVLVHFGYEDSIEPWLRALRECRDTAAPPVILLSPPRPGVVSMAVEALKAGAWDFLETPFNGQLLLDSVQRAVSDHERAAREQEELRALQARVESLTPRERQVLEPLVRGWSNRRMAATLGVTEKTVEAYRARIMRKTGAAHLPQLMRMAIRGGVVREALLAPATCNTTGRKPARQSPGPDPQQPAARRAGARS